ncbi:zinc finger, GRF-type [Artemisia annua]|uniref:Zinc finger, GRF-type n=1 Tax=Artemisia annua TaxID=35608 RepID=A0A2U1M8V7_ARTAN|nr:zinc finger, GRF-type [Artemisia annua]
MICSCGRRTIPKTSWTDINPGRRFHRCPKPNSTCPFNDWIDPPMCNRAAAVIPGLLRGRNRLEAQLMESEMARKRMKKMLVITWLCLVVYFVLKM